MPLLTNSIGGIAFIDLRGNVLPREEELELLKRPGYDGVLARKIGARGRPFKLTSVSYVTDDPTAQALSETFAALPGSDPVEIVQHSVSWGNYLLLGVKQTRKQAMANCTAGAYTVRLEHEWEFIG